MIAADTRPRRLISDRFRYTACATVVPLEGQRRAMREFVDRLHNGTYTFVSAPCPCGEPSEEVVVAEIDRYRLPLTSVLCFACGTVRIDPYLDGASLGDFYRTLYQDLYGRSTDPGEYFERQRAYGRKILARVGGHRILAVLEVGCGAGGALSVFHEAGHFVAGCEYSGRLVNFGVRQGVPNVHVGAIQELAGRLGRDRFDVIFLHHVYEHVDEPVDTLVGLHRVLEPEGQLLIIVPSLTGIRALADQDVIDYFHVAHKYNYSPLGLQLIARRAGLGSRRVEPPAGMPTAWTHIPELWMEVTHSPGPLPTCTQGQRPGLAVLRYLRRTERLHRLRSAASRVTDRLQASPLRRVVAATRRISQGWRSR